MDNTIYNILWPLILWIPFWFLLLKSRQILARLNKGKFGRKRLAIIDGLQSIRIPLFFMTMTIFFRHATHELFPDNDGYMLIFMEKHGYFFISLFLLTFTIITFSNTYRKDLQFSYVIEELQNQGSAKSKQKTYVDAISKVVNGFAIVIAIILLLDHFGVPASSILAFGGMGSLVIGFAVKDLLSDIASGILLYADDFFKIDEWIKVEEPPIEGIVKSIGWRSSQIMTFDGRPLYVPNRLLSTATVQNVSRRESIRFKETLSLSLETTKHISDICKEIRNDIFLNHHGIDHTKPVIVNLQNFDGAVANIYMSAHTKCADTATFHAIRQEIWLKVLIVLSTHKAEIKAPVVNISK